MRKYFYTDGINKYGPFSKEELMAQKISRSTKIWYYGIDNWTELSDIPELNDVYISIPPEIISNKNYIKAEEIKPDERQTNNKTIRSYKNWPVLSRWFIGIVVVLLISFFVYSSILNQPEVLLYNEIEANSYESDENFEMYLEKFYRDLEHYSIYPQKPKTTSLKLSKLDQLDNTTHIHGVSFGSNDDSIIEIYINPSTWEGFNKPMRYFLMYHELAHDILNVDDLETTSDNEGKLMYPNVSSYENKNMDDFIESAHTFFEEQSTK